MTLTRLVNKRAAMADAFTLELDGRAPVVLKTGQAFVEPPNVKMTGCNRSSTEPLRVLIFYVSDPEAPFLDPTQ